MARMKPVMPLCKNSYILQIFGSFCFFVQIVNEALISIKFLSLAACFSLLNHLWMNWMENGMCFLLEVGVKLKCLINLSKWILLNKYWPCWDHFMAQDGLPLFISMMEGLRKVQHLPSCSRSLDDCKVKDVFVNVKSIKSWRKSNKWHSKVSFLL